jgi:hypothetical protein
MATGATQWDASGQPIFCFDFVSGRWNKSLVKSQKPARQKKGQPTSALERHRAMMNKLSAAERRRLRRRAAELLYGREVFATGG